MKIAIDGYSLSYSHTMGLFTYSSNFTETLGSKHDTVIIAPNNDFVTGPAQRIDYIESLLKRDPSRIHLASSDALTKIALLIINFLLNQKKITYEIFLLFKHQLWLRYLLPKTIRNLSDPIDAILYLNQYAIKTNLRVIHAAVIHDALAWYYYRGDKKLARLKQIIYGGFLTNLKKFDHIFAISITTKADLICEFGFDAKKIQITYENIASRYEKFLENRVGDLDSIVDKKRQVLEGYGLYDGRYILVNNPFNERKNSVAILHATKMAEKHNCKIIFIADAKKPREQEIKDSIVASAKPGTIEFIDVVDSDDLPYLYRGAACFCIFSLKEGFGLPPLEALASGTLVISSRVSTMLEFMVDFNVWFVNPFSKEEIASTVDKVLSLKKADREAKIAENDQKMHEFMRKYSWDNVIKQSLDGLEATRNGHLPEDL